MQTSYGHSRTAVTVAYLASVSRHKISVELTCRFVVGAYVQGHS